MAKRFTETAKWSDKWYRALDPLHKLAWQYLTDNCDGAGVIDLDRELADFQIGEAVDWDEFLEIAGGRIEVIVKGKLWIPGFIPFQYGTLSHDCNAHRPVFAALEKYSLNERVLEGYLSPTGGLMDKDKDLDKERVKEKEKEDPPKPKTTRFTPPTVDQVREYCQSRANTINADEFVDFYQSKGWKVGREPMKDWQAAVRTWEKSSRNRGSPPSGSAPRTRSGLEVVPTE